MVLLALPQIAHSSDMAIAVKLVILYNLRPRQDDSFIDSSAVAGLVSSSKNAIITVASVIVERSLGLLLPLKCVKLGTAIKKRLLLCYMLS